MAVDIAYEHARVDQEVVLGPGHKLPTTPEIAQEGARVFAEVIRSLPRTDDVRVALTMSEVARQNFSRCFVGTAPIIDDQIGIVLKGLDIQGLKQTLEPFSDRFSLINYQSKSGYGPGLVNIKAAKLVVKNHPMCFHPGVEGYLLNWLKAYPEKWVHQGLSPITCMRHGLFSGYPWAAVFKFSNWQSSGRTFMHNIATQGFFGYSKEDQLYCDQLEEIYLQSGMEEVPRTLFN